MAEREDLRHEVVGARRATLDERLESTNTHFDNQPKSEEIRRDIDATRAALDEKLGALQTKVRDVQTNVKQTFDINHQVAEHPWAMFGASIAVGFGLGMVLGGDDDDRSHWQLPAASAGLMYEGSRPSTRSRRDWSGLDDIFDTLKLAAGAAVTDLARQALHKYVPALGDQLDKIWKERGLTPTTAANALFQAARKPAEPESHGPTGGSYGEGGYGTQTGSSRASQSRMAQDYNPAGQPNLEGAGRAEMTSRS